MKLGIRTPSLKKSLAARVSVKRMVRHSLGVKATRYSSLTDPMKTVHKRARRRTTVSLVSFLQAPFR